MTKYEQYLKFNENGSFPSEKDYFEKLCALFDISIAAAYNIWYAEQRGWFKPEMVDELIRLDKHPQEFQPCLATGEFHWNGTNFIPEKL